MFDSKCELCEKSFISVVRLPWRNFVFATKNHQRATWFQPHLDSILIWHTLKQFWVVQFAQVLLGQSEMFKNILEMFTSCWLAGMRTQNSLKLLIGPNFLLDVFLDILGVFQLPKWSIIESPLLPLFRAFYCVPSDPLFILHYEFLHFREREFGLMRWVNPFPNNHSDFHGSMAIVAINVGTVL